MKKLFTLIFIIQLCQTAGAQTLDWAWAKDAVGSGNEEARHMCVDASGNIFITGLFTSPSVSFGTTVLTNSGTGGEFFLAKYDPSGNLLWVSSASGGGQDQGLSVSTDPAGNSYVTGSFESSSITFGTITLTNTSNLSDIFVVKYNPSGNVVWAKSYGGSLQDWGSSIVADASGNSYITGTFYSLGVLFDSFGVVNSGANDAFVTKLDGNGTAVWTDQIGGSLADAGTYINRDASGNIYVAGSFNSATLAAYSPNMINAGGSDVFFAKYDGNGNVLGSKQIGGNSDEEITSLALDASGNIYMTGYFESASLNLGAVTLNNSVSRSMLIVKFDQSGTALWGSSFAGNNFSYPTGLDVDGAGDVFISGSFNLPSLTFGSQVLNNGASATLNGFVVKFSGSSGTALWGMTVGAASNEEVFDVSADQNGNIFLTGNYSSALTLGNTALNGQGAPEHFLAKLCVVPQAPTAVSSLTVCNKAQGVFTVTPPGGSVANWYSAATGGSLLLASSNTYTASATGTFYVESQSNHGCRSSRTAVTLSVLPGASTSIAGKTITASPGNSYTWIECAKDSVLTSQTGQSFVLPYTGHYAVIVSANGCVDTSACNFYSVSTGGGGGGGGGTDTVIVTGLPEPEDLQAGILVYPNPNAGSFTIQSDFDGEFMLVNAIGQTVRRVELTEKKSRVDNLAPGLYFLRNSRNKTVSKIVVTDN